LSTGWKKIYILTTPDRYKIMYQSTWPLALDQYLITSNHLSGAWPFDRTDAYIYAQQARPLPNRLIGLDRVDPIGSRQIASSRT